MTWNLLRQFPLDPCNMHEPVCPKSMHRLSFDKSLDRVELGMFGFITLSFRVFGLNLLMKYFRKFLINTFNFYLLSLKANLCRWI